MMYTGGIIPGILYPSTETTFYVNAEMCAHAGDSVGLDTFEKDAVADALPDSEKTLATPHGAGMGTRTAKTWRFASLASHQATPMTTREERKRATTTRSFDQDTSKRSLMLKKKR